MLRRTIAAQEAQQLLPLTTFNEIDMQPVMSIRKKYQDRFVERHGVKLGFMSFFAKAAVEALRRYPAVNAEIQGDQVLYRHYQDIGVAIGGGKGLVVPILRVWSECLSQKLNSRLNSRRRLPKIVFKLMTDRELSPSVMVVPMDHFSAHRL